MQYRLRHTPGLSPGAIGIGRKSSPSWTPQQGASFFYQENTRSGLTLPNSITPGTNDASLLLPSYYNSDVNKYAIYGDTGNLDIGANDFSFGMWFNAYMSNNIRYLWGTGKTVTSQNGRYFLPYVEPTDNLIQGCFQSSTGFVAIKSNILITDQQWHFLLLDINQTTKKARLFVDNVQQGADVTYTGTFAAVNNFYIGSTNPLNNLTGAWSDMILLHRLLTPTERAACMNHEFPTDCEAYWPCSSGYKVVNITKNAYHLDMSSGDVQLKYSAHGSRVPLEKGYTLFCDPNNAVTIKIPYSQAGTPLAYTLKPNTYTKNTDIDGVANGLNGSDSLINFSGDEFDRSNTSNFEAVARTNYYDASVPKAWHQEELNNITIDVFSKVKGKIFVKQPNPITDTWISEIFSFSTAKSAGDITKILNYTNDEITSVANKAVISFHSDNGGVEDLTVLKPIFDTYGKKFSLMINGSTVGGVDGATGEPILSWAQLQTLQTAGFDIQCHGYNHVNETSLSEVALRQQVTDNIAAFIANGIASPTSHAWVGAGQNATTRAIIDDYYTSALGAGLVGGYTAAEFESRYNFFYVNKKSSKFKLQLVFINITTAAQLTALKLIIDKAYINKATLCLTAHSIHLTGYDYDATLMNELLDYIVNTKGIELLSHGQFWTQYGNHIT